MTYARWIGQAGFLLTWNDVHARPHALLIDGYLSDSLAAKYQGTLFAHDRLIPAPLTVNELPPLDAVLSTHAHTDHMDPGTLHPLFERDPNVVFVAPRAERKQASVRSGVKEDRMRLLDAGEECALGGGVTVQAVPAAHEELLTDCKGAYLCLGYVIRFPGVTIYHSGDCVPYPGQPEILAALEIDVAFLPVNGRDAYRRENGVPGNFNFAEAVTLCAAAGIPRLVPHHWGMFSFNTVDPAGFDIAGAYQRGITVVSIAPGDVFRVEGRQN